MYKIQTILFPALLLLLNIQSLSSLAATEENYDIKIELAQEQTGKEKTKSSTKITLNEILQKHYQAIGGEEAWQAIETLKFTGSMYTKDATFKTAAVYKRPEMCRLDFQAGRLYFMEAYDGKIPWQMNPGTRNGPKILKGKRANEMIDTCDFEGPLVDHNKKGHKIKYLGREKIEDRWAYLLEVKFKTGNTDTYYLDTETYLPFLVKGNTTIQDQTVNTAINISEYIEIGGILIPFSYEFIVDGNPSTETLKIKTVELNNEMDDDIFKLPKRPQDLR